MAEYFLGVDGGQSSTTALVGDETGRVLGHGTSGPCNHVSAAEARTRFVRVIEESLERACAQAGLDSTTVRYRAACLGFSGGPEDKLPILRGMLRADSLEVSTDAPIALAGATAGDPGIIQIAGTGSIAFGRNAGGKTARAGGWGYLYGDEGSAFYIARQALRAALMFEEGWGEATVLTRLLLEAAGASSANTLLHLWYTPEFPRQRVATFAKLVDEAAVQGDTVAQAVLKNAAAWLVAYTESVRGQLFMPGEEVHVAYIGGVFRSSLLLEEYRVTVESIPGTRCQAPRYGPAAGALLEAYRAAGVAATLSNVPEFKT